MDNYDIPKSILCKRDDITEWIKKTLKGVPISIETKGRNIFVRFQEVLICGVHIEDETYKIFNVSPEFADETIYQRDNDGTLFYYIDTIDECVGEIHRLIMYAYKMNKNNKNNDTNYKVDKNAHREKIEKIIEKLSKENPAITYDLDNKIDTPIYLNGDKVMHIYYRKDAVRINVKLNSKQYDIYVNELPKDIAYQKDSADPMATLNEYAFFVDDNNIEFVLRKLLIR
jgi:hypothetical protein